VLLFVTVLPLVSTPDELNQPAFAAIPPETWSAKK
jgi:hypothetical protein